MSAYYLVRSDTGDGGWSLHIIGTEDEDGIAPVLISGPSEWSEQHDGWLRPDQRDFDLADAIVAGRAKDGLIAAARAAVRELDRVGAAHKACALHRAWKGLVDALAGMDAKVDDGAVADREASRILR